MKQTVSVVAKIEVVLDLDGDDEELTVPIEAALQEALEMVPYDWAQLDPIPRTYVKNICPDPVSAVSVGRLEIRFI